MNLSNFEHYLTESMQNLHDLTHLDMVRFNAKLQLTHGFQSNPLPISIGFTEKEHLQIQDLLSESKFKDFCYALTNHHLEYLFIPINHKKTYQGFLKVGPFLSTPVTQSMIASIISREGFPLEYRNIIENYYTSLSVLSYDEIMNVGYVSYNLINPHQVVVKPVSCQAEATNQPVELITYDYSQQNLIEERYKLEKQMLYAIEIGDEKLLDKLTSSFASIFNLEERVPGNPLRSAKNIAFVVNTLSRTAAERGGLHPLHVHSLSEKYAILIEKATTSSEIDRLDRELLYEYLNAVHNHAYQDIGPTVKKIIQHIQFHLADSLTPHYSRRNI